MPGPTGWRGARRSRSAPSRCARRRPVPPRPRRRCARRRRPWADRIAGDARIDAAHIAGRHAQWAQEDGEPEGTLPLSGPVDGFASPGDALDFREAAMARAEAAMLATGIGAWGGSGAGFGRIDVVLRVRDHDRAEAALRRALAGTPYETGLSFHRLEDAAEEDDGPAAGPPPGRPGGRAGARARAAGAEAAEKDPPV